MENRIPKMDSVENLVDRVESGVREQPLVAASVAAVGGFCLGVLAARVITNGRTVDSPSQMTELGRSVLGAVQSAMPDGPWTR